MCCCKEKYRRWQNRRQRPASGQPAAVRQSGRAECGSMEDVYQWWAIVVALVCTCGACAEHLLIYRATGVGMFLYPCPNMELCVNGDTGRCESDGGEQHRRTDASGTPAPAQCSLLARSCDTGHQCTLPHARQGHFNACTTFPRFVVRSCHANCRQSLKILTLELQYGRDQLEATYSQTPGSSHLSCLGLCRCLDRLGKGAGVCQQRVHHCCIALQQGWGTLAS